MSKLDGRFLYMVIQMAKAGVGATGKKAPAFPTDSTALGKLDLTKKMAAGDGWVRIGSGAAMATGERLYSVARLETQSTINLSRDPIDVSSKGNGVREIIAGKADYSVDASMVFDVEDHVFDSFFSLVQNTNIQPVVFAMHGTFSKETLGGELHSPESLERVTDKTKIFFSGTALSAVITTCNVTAPDNDAVTAEFTLNNFAGSVPIQYRGLLGKS